MVNNMGTENQIVTIERIFPKVETEGMFKIIWVVFFGHPLTTAIKKKLDALIKAHQDGNKLMISRAITGKAVESREVYWKDYFSLIAVTYDDDERKSYIEFQMKSRQGFGKDLMIIFLREIRNEFPDVKIGSPISQIISN